MSNKYAILKQIIDLYEEYEQEGKPLNLLAFSQWIVNRLNEDPQLNKQYITKEKYSTDIPDAFSLMNKLSERARFLETNSRIARYHEFYIRKAFKDLIINSRLEFLFLKAVSLMENARKTDLINIYHLEYTTGMDTIRRLINNGLLNETQDESDKRAKLLVLTDKGKEVLEQAGRRINDENTMFFTAVNDNKWKKVLPVLEEIDAFHNNIYQKHGQHSFAELSNLMDSLKRFYK